LTALRPIAGGAGDEIVSPSIGGAPPVPGDVTWERLLNAAARGQHVVQLYTERDFLHRAASQFVSAGLRQGEAILLVVTTANREAIVRRVENAGFALDDCSRRGQMVVLDAGRSLAELLVGGLPVRKRFQVLIGGAVKAVQVAGFRRLRAFGEMADVLRQASLAAALQLEELWTELVTTHGIARLCGYSIDIFDPQIYRGFLQRLSMAHSHLVPVEDYAQLDRAVELAYAEVFGPGHDAGFLRRSFLAHYRRPTAMPDAEAALLATQEFVPSAADALLDRVRYHYRHPVRAGWSRQAAKRRGAGRVRSGDPADRDPASDRPE
jgi:hypothetical protein